MTYESSDDVSLTQPKPSTVDLRTLSNQNASNADDTTNKGYASLSPAAPQPGAGQSHKHDLDADVYSSADGVDGNPTLATPSGSQLQVADVYSFVSKPKPPKKLKPAVIEYAVVDKIRSEQTGRSSRPKNDGDVASPDVYAQVNKSAKRGNSDPSRPSQLGVEGETYAQVQKPKSAAKPVPATKPKPATTAKPAIRPKPGQQGRKPSNNI